MALTWTKEAGCWHAEGLRIELSSPFRWLLLDDTRQVDVVSIADEPLAVARTLTEAKREAELVLAQRRRAELRRKHLIILGLLLAVAMFFIEASTASSLGILFVLSVMAFRSLGVVTGTILWKASGPQPETFYQ